jgi:hypothetical protein
MSKLHELDTLAPQRTLFLDVTLINALFGYVMQSVNGSLGIREEIILAR